MNINYKIIKMDNEASYSLSHKTEADKLSEIIKEKFGNISIFDATASVGGNTMSFCINFKEVKACEIDKTRYEMLKTNL